MTDQERIIEQKKREIESKQLQQKLKQHEEALTKMVPKAKPQPSSRTSGHIHAQGFQGTSRGNFSSRL